jgi:hypothetical protein
MRDFTLTTYRRLFEALKAQQYQFQPFAEFLQKPAPKAVILRHDVDARKMNSLATAKLEAELDIKGTYYFRMVPQSFSEDVIREIYWLGHEIGYHYEDLALARGDYEKAIQLFTRHLAKLRQVEPISTICMHGSPLSRFDNRKLWDKYNYRDFGIIGEPYFDVDFNRVRYLTDTGRRWDGEKVSIRDKAMTDVNLTQHSQHISSFHSTFDLINTVESGKIPDQLMITVHPQRWDDRFLQWFMELVFQNSKNVIKRVMTKMV